MNTSRRITGLAHRDGRFDSSSRELAAEVAVAISYNGTSHAVLMATPDHLEDLAVGFSLSEGIVSTRDEIDTVTIVEGARGIDAQVWLTVDATRKLEQRRRSMAGPVGCGLCGIESIDEAMRDLAPVSAEARLSAADIAEAARAMTKAQALNLRTRSVHAAACYYPGRGLVGIREDVGRHNALDKLIGAMTAEAGDMSLGAVIMTSRLSVELVQKTAAAKCGILVAISAPTALAVEMADKANITLAAVVRDAEFEIFTHPHRIMRGGLKHVA